jgi:tRNA threonylcarbamoyladenosine biosynthesis protein TsaE
MDVMSAGASTVEWKSLEEGRAWVRGQLAQWQRPCVVLLEGPMGAGKTQVAKWIVEGLTAEDATSPTFGVHHRYSSARGDVDHVDLYRLNSDEDLESTGFWDLFADSNGFVIVEWADRLPDSVWPAHWRKIKLKISVNSDQSRRCDLSG